MIIPIVEPYLTVATFKAYPTYLDLQNLRSGDSALAHQDAELYNMLLRASSWAYDQCDQPLHAHTLTENTRLRPDREGRLKFHSPHNPVKALTALSYGYSPDSMQAVTDLSSQWIEDDRQISLAVTRLGGAFTSIQFGSPSAGTQVYTRWTVTAGYVSTVLAADVALGATSVTVKDPTGLVAGDVLRIWEPGLEEAVTVAPSYVTGSTTVPLTTGLANLHTSGAGISQMPAAVQQAVVNYAVALLLRPDTAKEDAFPDARVDVATRGDDSRQDGSGLVAEAVRLLRKYHRTR